MPRSAPIGVVLVLGLALGGCAARQYSYRFTRINGVPALAPPGYKDSDRQVRVRVPRVAAAKALQSAGECDLSLPEFRLAWAAKSQAAVATVDLDALFPDGAYDTVARLTFEKFRAAMESLEERKGCFVHGGGRLLADRVAEALPMPFQDVAFYRNGYDAFRASVELRPGMRLLQQSVTGEAAKPVRTQFVSYDVVPGGGNGDGVTLHTTVKEAGDMPVVKWDAGALAKLSHYRLFLRTRFINEPGNRPERHAVLLGAMDLNALLETTPRFLSAPEAVCGDPKSTLLCTVFPNRVTIGPEVPVTVKGRPGYVDVVATVYDLVKRQKPAPKDVAARLDIRREWAGKHVKVDLKGAGALAVKLPLVAGDRVRW